MLIDFERTRHDYAAYRAPYPQELFNRLQRFDIGCVGQRVLDLGAGTGLFGQELAAKGCNVLFSDPSPGLLQKPGSILAKAEAIPLEDASFDIVSAAQCWHWFDREVAPGEILRVLRPGGWVVVVYQMYIPLPGSLAEASEALILKHAPRWRHANSAGINGQVLRDVQAVGFNQIESFTFDISIGFDRERWRGFIRTTSPIGASMPLENLGRFEEEHAQLLLGWPESFQIPHRVFAAVARKPIIGSYSSRSASR